jgi:inner membrane protein
MILGAALGVGCAKAPRRGAVLLLGAVCAAVPDLDAIGYRLGVPYESMFGHRGFSHSLLFASLLAAAIALTFARTGLGGTPARTLLVYLAVATASHGVLDALTDGGLGVAFLAPFSGERFFFPWHPIAVSPLSLRRFFTERGMTILGTEIAWVWLPAAAIALAGLALRRPTGDPPARAAPNRR